jgi:hypothetical protein
MLGLICRGQFCDVDSRAFGGLWRPKLDRYRVFITDGHDLHSKYVRGADCGRHLCAG